MDDETFFTLTMVLGDIKTLFQAGKFAKCVAHCASLLEDTQQFDKQIHPLHRASVFFYKALAHDALARTMSMASPSRHPSLDLAEECYSSAIEALTGINPSSITEVEKGLADKLPSSSNEAATSVTDEMDDMAMLDALDNNKTLHGSEHLEAYNAKVTAFLGLVQGHLNSVRELKEVTVPTPFPTPPARLSTNFAKPRNRNSRDRFVDDDERERVRKQRREMVFRPKFDPKSIQQLCNDALAELRK